MKKLFLMFTASALILTSCGSDEKKEDKKSDKKEAKENKEESTDCTYQIDPEGIQVNFTAYKYEENKTGVKGKFEEITISGAMPSNDPLMAANGISFTIPIGSLYTGDPSRDKKIKESFFGTMVATEMLTGSVKSIEGEKVIIELKMNEISFNIDATQKLEGENILLEGELNTDNWNGQDAIAALNKVCEAKHTDPEAGGKSYLWPDVTISIQGHLLKECK